MSGSQKYIVLVCLGLIGCTSAAQTPPTSMPASAVAPISAPTLAPRATRTPDTPTSTPALLPTNEVDDYLSSASPIEHLPLGRAVELTSLTMFDGLNGWATGFAQGSPTWTQHKRILRTYDGGKTWIDVTPPWPAPGEDTRTLGVEAFFLDPQRAWVAHMPRENSTQYDGTHPLGHKVPPLTIWRTSDSGMSWEVASPSFPNPMRDAYYDYLNLLHFSDESNGWLGVEGNELDGSSPSGPPYKPTLLLRTRDGGRFWERVLDLEDRPVLLSPGVYFGGDVLFTRDGGSTWEWQALPVPPDGGTSFSLCTRSDEQLIFPLRWKALVFCHLYLGGGIPYLYDTADAGVTWEITQLPLLEEEASEWYSGLFFLNEELGWFYAMGIESLSTEIFLTEDGGASWRQIGTGDWGERRSAQLSFANPEIGWAVVSPSDPDEKDNRMFRTADGGATWEEITPIIGQALGRPAGPVVLCPDVPPSRVAEGFLTRVTYTDGSSLAIRTEAGLSTGERIDYLPEGTRMTILDGPVCADDFAWWQVETADGLTGWVAEGDWEAYFLEPLE
jgi:photosystem II stability/assembly factor-like uncharacterized protein